MSLTSPKNEFDWNNPELKSEPADACPAPWSMKNPQSSANFR